MSRLAQLKYAATPKSGSPNWLRVLVSALFLCLVNHGPLHLAFETHLYGLLASGAGGVDGRSLQVIQAESGEPDHHPPHLASDHLLRLAPHAPAHVLSFDGITTAPSAAWFLPEPHTLLFLTERQNPPGIPPPDPLQSRAPPFA